MTLAWYNSTAQDAEISCLRVFLIQFVEVTWVNSSLSSDSERVKVSDTMAGAQPNKSICTLSPVDRG